MMPLLLNNSTKPLILSSSPVASTITESTATSTILARKISTSWAISARSLASARTLTRARSRITVGVCVTSLTSSTLMSFARFASTSEAGVYSVSTRIVIRETSGRCVRPTVRLSMLKARRRKRLATRFNTPGLSSTSATSVCFIIFPQSKDLAGCLRGGYGTADHFVKVGACGHHWINGIFCLDLEIDQDRAGVLPRRLDRRDHLFAPGHVASLDAVGI